MLLQNAASIVAAIAWCLVVFSAITGFGAMLLHFAKVGNSSAGLCSIAGFGITIFLGGILNAVKLLGKTTSLAFVAAGVICLLYILLVNRTRISIAKLRRQRSTLEKIVLVIFFTALAWQLVASASISKFNSLDDQRYYLAVPKKIMQTHEFGADPFSQRRVTTTVGGGYFLESLILAGSPLDKVAMADRGLGIFLCIALIFDIALCFELSAAQMYLFGVIMFAATPPFHNLTFFVLPFACFLAFPVLLTHPAIKEHPAWTGILLGSLFAVESAIKSTNIVQAGVFLILAAGLIAWRKGAKKTMPIAVGTFVVGAAVLLPWCAMNWKTSGTAYFPLLGHGYDYSTYHQLGTDLPLNYFFILSRLKFIIPAITAFAVIESIVAVGVFSSECAVLLTFAAAAGMIALDIGTRGDDFIRHGLPCLAAAVLYSVPVYLQRGRRPAASARFFTVKRAFLYASVIELCSVIAYSRYFLPSRASSGMQEAFHLNPEIYSQYAALNSLLPGCGKSLVSVYNTHLIDFSKSDVYIADWPGTAGPPNGWPLDDNSGEQLKKYLLQYGIRCVAYVFISQPDAPGSGQEAQNAYNSRNVSQFIQDLMQGVRTTSFQFQQLSKVQRHIFDSAELHVLDLNCTQQDLKCQSPSLQILSSTPVIDKQ